jgi:hypothetical protein
MYIPSHGMSFLALVKEDTKTARTSGYNTMHDARTPGTVDQRHQQHFQTAWASPLTKLYDKQPFGLPLKPAISWPVTTAEKQAIAGMKAKTRLPTRH